MSKISTNSYKINVSLKSMLLLVLILNLIFNISIKAEIPNILTNDYNPFMEYKHHNCSHIENLKSEKSKRNVILTKKIENSLHKITPAYSNYDVLNYDLFMDWSELMNPDSAKMSNRNYKGKMIMTVVLKENGIDSLEFNSEAMLIKSSSINGNKTKVLFDTTKYLNAPNYVFFDKDYSKGDTLIIEFEYTHIGNQQAGLHFYTPEHPNALEIITYTMSEPELARIWMPCKDRPDDKATSKISVRVPVGYEVLANGLLIDSIVIDKTVTFVWENDIPIPTYLMHVIASKYFKWTDYFKKKSGDSIEVSYYAWANDMPEFNPSSTYLPRESMSKTVEMLEFFSEFFNEYPYQKYSQAAASPFPYGGMEHQTATTIHRNWLKNTSELGVVHEVGHHWLGNMISCATWNDIWINEGGASWIEWLWVGNQFNQERYDEYIRFYNNVYLNQSPYVNSQEIFGIPPAEIFTNKNVYLVYTKAGLVYNMLYKMYGNEFVNALNKTLEDYKFQSITTEQIKESLKKYIPNPVVDFDIFFEQWIYKPAHPYLNMDSYFEMVNGKYVLHVKLNQQQKEIFKSDVEEVFKVQFDLLINTDIGTDKRTILLDEKLEEFTFELDYEPLDVNIDLATIIAVVNKNPMGIKNTEIEKYGGLSIYPNPSVNDKINIRLYNLPIENSTIKTRNFNLIESYEIYDITGNLLKNAKNLFSENIEIDVKGLANGTYTVIVKTPTQILHNNLVIIR